tara:strand:+ start:506 stop:2122 length:1617 start_codon:yes stop_codon:yes gene_type:complete
MRGIFPETKRPWSDGLNLFDDTRDYYELRFGLFGGDDDSGGGGGLSDEDIDQDLQQDIAAAASGLSRDQFDYSEGFDPGDSDTATAIDATRDIIDASARGNEAAIAAQRAAAASPAVQQAIANLTNVPVGSATPVQDIFTRDAGMITDMSPVEQRQIAAQQQLDTARNQAATFAPSPVGIQTLGPPGRTLGDSSVYSAVLNNPMRQDERTMNPADFEAQYGFAPRGIAGITAAPQVDAQVVLGGGTDDMGSGVPLGGSYDRFAPAIGMQDEYLPEDIAAGFGQYVGGPGGGPGASGLSTFADRQKRAQEYAEAMGYDLTDRSTMKRGAERGFSGITEEQKADLEKRAAGSIFGDTFMNTPRNINKILEDNRATGIYTNPDGTVRGVTGLPDPDAFGGLMQKGVNFLGGFIPDFIGETYTGTGPNPFDRGQDPGGSDDGGEVKSPMDPCPEGFVLKDGVCTPVDQAGEDAGGGPGSDFKILPIAPPTFQPITQATPVNQINPFVLQPYTPMQAQNIGASRVAQGIQGVSPTGAALGRQI